MAKPQKRNSGKNLKPPRSQLTCHRPTRSICRLLRTRLFNVGRGKKFSPQPGTSPSTLKSRVLHNRQSGKLIVSGLDRVPPLDFVHIRLGSPCACLRPGSTTFPKGKPGTRQPRSQAACQPARQTARQLWGRGPGRIPEGRTPGGLRQATSQPARQLALGSTTGTITEQ